jgi:transposase
MQGKCGKIARMTTSETTTIESVALDNLMLRHEVDYLKEQLNWFRRQVFGQKSEKIVANLSEKQLSFEGFDQLDKAEEEQKQKVPAHERRKAKRDGKDKIRLPEDLPVVTQFIDIPENEKHCEKTGKPLEKIGEEVNLKIAYQPGNHYVKETIRPKYALPKGGQEGIRIAPLPESLLDRCQADESLLAHILTMKYGDHLPLYRVQEIFARDGIHISRQTLSNWVIRCGLALEPIYNEIKRRILESGNIFVDEVAVPLQVKGKGKHQTAYQWVLSGGNFTNPPWRIYEFYPDRKHKNVETLLLNYRGVMHSDKYGAYESLASKKDSPITWCPCWVHIRRKFFEAESGDPELRAWVLRKIRYLFMFEYVAWSRSEEERLRIRREKEERIIDELISRIKDRLTNGKHLPKSKFREALGYFCSLIPYLKNYLSHPFARLDNNVAERAVRPVTIGRKNWLCVGSPDAGKSAGIILSLVQTCRALRINPQKYLEDVMRRLMSHNSQKLFELLPDQWALDKDDVII